MLSDSPIGRMNLNEKPHLAECICLKHFTPCFPQEKKTELTATTFQLSPAFMPQVVISGTQPTENSTAFDLAQFTIRQVILIPQ